MNSKVKEYKIGITIEEFEALRHLKVSLSNLDFYIRGACNFLGVKREETKEVKELKQYLDILLGVERKMYDAIPNDDYKEWEEKEWLEFYKSTLGIESFEIKKEEK